MRFLLCLLPLLPAAVCYSDSVRNNGGVWLFTLPAVSALLVQEVDRRFELFRVKNRDEEIKTLDKLNRETFDNWKRDFHELDALRNKLNEIRKLSKPGS